jgi:sigma-B regulation protein RsbU (phosphoserine phosphatase)
LLADVSGKGMPAALLGASLHAAVRSHSANSSAGCGEVLARASRLLYETTALSRYATVFYGVYDPATRRLDYANAGHCPPMLVRGKECIRLDSLTPPAGLLPVLPAMQESVELMAGDWLLIFSDGIPEASGSEGEDFGDGGLLDALDRARNGTAAEACEGIANEVRNYVHDQRQGDDITLIAVRVL